MIDDQFINEDTFEEVLFPAQVKQNTYSKPVGSSQKEHKTRECEYCKRLFMYSRRTAQYCSEKCRVYAYRNRRA